MKRHLKITITGHVQGVGFRFQTSKVASMYGIKGFVKNIYPDTVYIEAEGDQNRMESFLQWCKKGPSHATVKDIIAEEGDLKNYTNFSIKH